MLAQAAAVFLVCEGTAVFDVSDQTQASAFGGGEYVSGTSTTTKRVRERDQAEVEILGEVVRVRPPAVIAPNVSGSGDQGWRTLTDLEMTAESIDGRFSYNWIDKPRVRIDRMTGEIRIQPQGLVRSGTFVGQCRRVERSATPLF